MISKINKYKNRTTKKKALTSNIPEESLVKLMRKRVPRKTILPSLLSLPDGSTSSDLDKIAEAFNHHFASSMNQSNADITSTKPTMCSTYLNTIDITPEDIIKALAKTKISTFPGPDNIPSIVYKKGGPEILTLLLHIFKLSIHTATFPSCWKKSIIIPKHKSGSQSMLANYQPIHHTSVASRILERIINTKLIKHLTEHIITPAQHGFLSKKSRTTCNIAFLDQVTKAIDDQQALIVIYLDMTKAFDRVPHKPLLSKLAEYGIQDPLLSWIKSFLQHRSQSVQVNKITSKQ